MAARGLVNGRGPLRRSGRDTVSESAVLLLCQDRLKSELLEEVVALVINEDECREVLDMDLPYRFHSELRIFNALDALDVVLSKDCCRTSDRAEVESAVLVASVSHALCAISLCKHDHAAAVALEKIYV